MSKESSETKSTDLNFADVVNSWTKIGSHCWSSSGNDIYCAVGGSPSTNYHSDKTNANERWSPSLGFNAWWGSGLIDPKGYETNDFDMEFTLVNNGTMHNGVMFNVTRNEDGSLNGYLFSLTTHFSGDRSKSSGALFKMENYQLDCSFSAGLNQYFWCHGYRLKELGTESGNSWYVGKVLQYGNQKIEVIAAWPYKDGNNLKYKCSYHKGKINITCNGSPLVNNLEDTTYTYGTYGFYGCNCEQVASMKLSDFNIKTLKGKEFGEVLLNNKWRDNSIRNVTNIQNKIDNTLLDNAVITNTLNNDIHFIQWGSVENKGVIDKFLNAIEQNGTNFYYKKEDITGD